MISSEVQRLEHENYLLRSALEEIQEKMNHNAAAKPKSCQYCKYYVRHYVKSCCSASERYIEIHEGHCIRGVPVKRGGKKNPNPDDTCPYFEIGTERTRMV